MLVTLALACQPQPFPGTADPGFVRAESDSDSPYPPFANLPMSGLIGNGESLANEGNPVRFVALGDAGMGNRTQYEVGGAVAQVCAVRECDFALYLGDNFYGPVPLRVDAPQFQERFELPYAALWFPFLVVLGNHDYGENLDYPLVQTEVDYTAYSDKWTLPHRSYSVVDRDLQLFGLDTEAILFGDAADQAELLDRQVTVGAPWKIAFGHHPYLSNGLHGNAGAYDGLDPGDPADAVPRGDNVAAFFAEHVCGKVDVYFAGHDHNRQWLYPTCGTNFIVSGAAARPSPRGDAGNPVLFEDFDKAGFVWVEIDGDEMRLAFYDDAAQLDFEGVLHR